MSCWKGSNSLVSNFTSCSSVDSWLNSSILPVNIPDLLKAKFRERWLTSKLLQWWTLVFWHNTSFTHYTLLYHIQIERGVASLSCENSHFSQHTISEHVTHSQSCYVRKWRQKNCCRTCHFMPFNEHFCPRGLRELKRNSSMAHLHAMWREREETNLVMRCMSRLYLWKVVGFVFDKH